MLTLPTLCKRCSCKLSSMSLPPMAIQQSSRVLCLANSSSVTVSFWPPTPVKSLPLFPSRIQSMSEWPGVRATLLRTMFDGGGKRDRACVWKFLPSSITASPCLPFLAVGSSVLPEAQPSLMPWWCQQRETRKKCSLKPLPYMIANIRASTTSGHHLTHLRQHTIQWYCHTGYSSLSVKDRFIKSIHTWQQNSSIRLALQRSMKW